MCARWWRGGGGPRAAGSNADISATPMQPNGRRLTLVSSHRQSRKPRGSSTCSMTSMAQTMSNCLPSCTRSSAAQCRYSREFLPTDEDDEGSGEVAVGRGGIGEAVTAKEGSREAWVCATVMLAGEASMASVVAPSREMAFTKLRVSLSSGSRRRVNNSPLQRYLHHILHLRLASPRAISRPRAPSPSATSLA